jgi:CRP/FNR family transcriptional regulator
VEIDEDGNETIKDIISKGDLFGESTLEMIVIQTNMPKHQTSVSLMSDFENL